MSTLTDEKIIEKYELSVQNTIENHKKAINGLEPLGDDALFYTGELMKQEEYKAFLEEQGRIKNNPEITIDTNSIERSSLEKTISTYRQN